MAPVLSNDLFKQQQGRLIRSTFKKAVISAINTAAFTADVYFAENPSTVIRSIPLAGHIDPAKIMVGDRCRVDVFDETNQRDMVVAYVYGRNMTGGNIIFNGGIALVHGAGPVLIAHGLNVIPDIYNVIPANDLLLTPQYVYIDRNTPADATNIYLKATSISFDYYVYWFAVKFLTT